VEGYDIVLVQSLFAQPAFAQRYGTFVADVGGATTATGSWQIPASWQSALGTAPIIGAILGAFVNGWLTHHWGYRRVLLVSLGAMTGFVFVLFFATSLTMLLVGLILCGMPWGVFATMAPAYASEVTYVGVWTVGFFDSGCVLTWCWGGCWG
jgi:SP family general alpha glucoside:H+ symporter-like MFS transporter